MPASVSTTLKFNRGETYRFTAEMFTETDGEVTELDLTGAVVHFCMKQKLSDAALLIDKDSSGADITISATPTDGTVSFVIQSSDTVALTAGSYRYSIWAVLASGDKKPMEGNGCLVLEDVCEVP